MLKILLCDKDSFYKHCCHAQDSITAVPKIHSTRYLSYQRFIVQDYCHAQDSLYKKYWVIPCQKILTPTDLNENVS